MPIPIQIERKFLIKKPNEEFLTRYNSIKLDIVQTYLKSDNPSVERRIRQRGSNGDFSYFYSEKREITPLRRLEVERNISLKEYLILLTEGVSTIRKERYCFFSKNQYFELDVYPNWDDNAILEIELTEENQEIEIPEELTVIEDVTGNPKYLNSNLAK